MGFLSSLFYLGIVLVVLVYAVQTLSSFENESIGSCVEGMGSENNNTHVNGAGSVTLTLPSYLIDSGNLTITHVGSGNVSVNGCVFSSAPMIHVPESCMGQVTHVDYVGMNVTNTEMNYSKLLLCSYASDSYQAIKSSRNASYSLLSGMSALFYGFIGIVGLFIVITALGWLK